MEGLGWRGPQVVSCPLSATWATWATPSLRLSLQVAVIAGNFELGELIRNHREQDVGERVGFGAKRGVWGNQGS